ncbi:hypothetical protein LIER_33656 [Lithospermum erythrorhizon]|uniref:Uncharacterized protein n=1 Tax=Lithospermum erythrorhizon TaxID=34254 RepID=A0AAV3RZ29_LITER
MANILPSWEFVHNIIDGSVRRIIVAWNTSFLFCEAIEVMDQHILFEVGILGGGTFLLSAVYGANLYVQRRCLWQSLVLVRTRGIHWLLAGDFNIIKDITLTSENTYPRSIAMEEFNGCLESIDVVELTSHGCLYTWGLSRWLVKGVLESWTIFSVMRIDLKVFSQSCAHFLPPGISDHAQIVIHLKQDIVSGPRPFKYHSFCQAHPSYGASFTQAWGVVDIEGSILDRLMRRIKHVKQALSKLNKVHYSEISARVQECSEQLRVVQTDIFQGRLTQENLILETNLRSDLVTLSRAELEFMKSRATITWLEHREFGTRFFSRFVLA